MFLPLDTTKTYVSVRDCLDGLKGHKLHDIAQKISQARQDVMKQMQQSTNRKRVLGDEMSQNVEEFLEAKHLISKKFSKQVFNLIEPRKIEQEDYDYKVECSETKELQDDLLQLKEIIKLAYEKIN